MASIIVMSGAQKGDYYPLGRRTNVVGRDEGAPIQILDEHISRKHMQIRFDSDKNQYCALDSSSRRRTLPIERVHFRISRRSASGCVRR
ncbi:MAG: hypothetical protein AMJ65_13220 [Phycisphaerae bacterium SG8_4]|nr:MAG: hypothetical protein AMJ65_13220 [Phycisphaerae bacterium SG8_4]